MEKVDKLDYNINLVLGSPIPIEDRFHIKQFTINDIKKNIGFSKYYAYINMICIDPLSIKMTLNTIDNVSPYDFIMANCYHDKTGDFVRGICDGLSLFLGEQVGFDYTNVKLFTDNHTIGMLDFEDIVEAIRNVNCMDKGENIEVKNEAQLQYMINSRKMKAKYAGGSQSDLSDIISSVCAKHPSINLFNVGELTVYQLIEQYKRLNMIDSYFISVKSLIAGADKKDVDLKHWSEKLK